MSLSIHDAEVLRDVIKKGRSKMHLTQAQCAELMDCSLSFIKELEICRSSPSIENFYLLCRTLNLSPNECIFPEKNADNPTYQELINLLNQCDEAQLRILLATTKAILNEGKVASSDIRL